ncbi:MAG: hypothetical protein AMXMBFR34_39060 [Myxococcaceae bacterium]
MSWLCAVALLASCYPGISGSGRVVSESRTVPVWNRVEIHSGMKATLSVGQPSVTVRTDDNLQGFIDTFVTGAVLVVQYQPGAWLWATVSEVIITNPAYEGIEASGGSHVAATVAPMTSIHLGASGGSDVNAAGIAGEDVRIEASGDSDVTAVGSANALFLDASGDSDVFATQLPVRTAAVEVSGDSDAEVAVSDSISGSVSGGSDLIVVGRPASSRLSVTGGSDVRFVDQ